MISPLMVARLRRIGIWRVASSIHRIFSLPTCSLVHRVIRALEPDYVPLDLLLKHRYDYEPVQVDPRAINGRILIDAGVTAAGSGPRRLLGRYRAWQDLDGGWKSVQQHVTRNIAGRFIAGGDWDLSRVPFEPLPSVVEIFVEGVPPEETADYQKFVSWIEQNQLVWTRGFRSVEDIDQYFADLDRIYEDIRCNGYRTQKELGNSGSDEIRICIDRNGELNVFGGGTHRLSIALLLELETVPVLVKRVHTHWVRACVNRYGERPVIAIARGLEDLTNGDVPNEVGSPGASTEPAPSSDDSVTRERPAC